MATTAVRTQAPTNLGLEPRAPNRAWRKLGIGVLWANRAHSESVYETRRKCLHKPNVYIKQRNNISDITSTDICVANFVSIGARRHSFCTAVQHGVHNGNDPGSKPSADSFGSKVGHPTMVWRNRAPAAMQADINVRCADQSYMGICAGTQ